MAAYDRATKMFTDGPVLDSNDLNAFAQDVSLLVAQAVQQALAGIGPVSPPATTTAPALLGSDGTPLFSPIDGAPLLAPDASGASAAPSLAGLDGFALTGPDGFILTTPNGA